MTKTCEDRVIQLCPRAIVTLKRQLNHYRRLKARGSINHDHLFFGDDGLPFQRLGHVTKCWRKSSERLGLRDRRPYVARHTSVSWNLMIGKNPLLVARQHGHSVATMFRTYAAWMQDAPESEIRLIRSAMKAKKSARRAKPGRQSHLRIAPVARLATGNMASERKTLEFTAKRSGGEGGIRTHVPELPDHPISSRRRCDHFGTSPVNLKFPSFT